MTETLVHDRQRRMRDDAARTRLLAESQRPVPLRARAGWFLVDAGLRLARPAGMRSDSGGLTMLRAR